MTATRPVVFIIDNEPLVRDSLNRLLRFAEFDVRTFDSARKFLGSELPDVLGCLVLDVQLPDLSGLDLQRKLRNANVDLPVIFVTSHGDIPTSVRAMKAGAVEFLTEPCQDQDLLEAVQRAVALSRSWREQHAEMTVLQQRYASLTPREREVFFLVGSGLLNMIRMGEKLGIRVPDMLTHRTKVP